MTAVQLHSLQGLQTPNKLKVIKFPSLPQSTEPPDSKQPPNTTMQNDKSSTKQPANQAGLLTSVSALDRLKKHETSLVLVL